MRKSVICLFGLVLCIFLCVTIISSQEPKRARGVETTPNLVVTGIEQSVSSTKYTLSVTNWSEFPEEMFEPSPDLPPCGLNRNASRTWVDILDEDGTHLYGFCGFSSPENLKSLWFAVKNTQRLPDLVYIILTDRRCNITYESNLVSIATDVTPPRGSIIINNGDEYTGTTTVTLRLEAYDDESEAIFADIYGDVERDIWVDIWPLGENVVEWRRELTTGDGKKTVYAVFEDEAGNASSPVFDTIILDETQPTSVITRPKENETISGIYEIEGTAYDVNFLYYRLEFGVGSSPPSWYDIGFNPRFRSVTSGLLGTWDTNDMVDGEYTIRLTVRDQMGKETVDSVVVNVGNEIAEFPNEYTEDFDTGETGRFYIQQWDGGPVGDVVFDMCRICDEFGIPDLCETCEEFVKVVQLKPERGAGITMRFPEEETGVKFSGDVVIVQTWMLSDNVEIGILITDEPVIDGEDPRRYETFGFLVVQEDGRWVFTEYANGTPSFGEDFGFPVEVWPGDTNDDGLVDGRDVLAIGRYWNMAGPSREYGSCDWEGQMASKWITEAATHADANGDGIVDGRDVLCIGLNWGRIHRPANFDRSEPMVSIPFEQQRWYNVALKFEPVGQSEFVCTVYIDGVQRAETMLNVWDLNLSQAFVNLVTYRGPDSDSSGVFDGYKFKSTCVSDDNIRPSGSITINDGDASTSSPVVTLTLRARDTGSGLAYVYIDGNLNTTPGRQLRRLWPAGVGTLSWNNVELTSGDGQKMIYAVFEDRACNRSAMVRDSIRLDTSPGR